MHHALEILEIRQEIYKWFRMPVTWRPELNPRPGKPLRDDRGAIVNLACARRDFYEELMPILWRNLIDFRFLLQLIPQYREPLPERRDDQRESGTFDIDSLCSNDVSRYLHYAKYVEELGWDIRLGQPFKDLEGYQILLDALGTSHPRSLLPSLQSLHIYRRGRNEVITLPPFFVPFPSLTCFNFLGHDKITNLIGLFGCNHFDDVPSAPLRLTKLCLREVRSRFPEEIVFLIRNSPSLTHLLLPNSVLRDWLADEVIDAGLELVAVHFERYEPKALAKLLDFVAPSLQWLKITGSATTDGDEVLLSAKEFPVLRELYFNEYRPTPYKLGNILQPRLPSLRTLGVNVDRAPWDEDPTPGTLAILQKAGTQHPTLWNQVTSLLLTMNSWLLRYEGNISWGNTVLSLFPNLENLSINVNGGPTTISEDQPLIHPNLRHLRLCSPDYDSDYESMLRAQGSLRSLVPRLETIAFHKSWRSERWVCELAERHDLEVKILMWEDESVDDYNTGGNLEVWTAGIDV